MLGSEALEGTDRDRFVEHAAAADGLARGGADPPAHRWERIDLRGDRIGLVVTPRPDESDVPAGIGAGGTGSLAGSQWDGWPARLHRAPDLPPLGAIGRVPRQQGAPRGRVVAFEHLACHARHGEPTFWIGGGGGRTIDRALAWRERGLAPFGDEGHDDDRAFTDADAAADALADLDRVLHHPVLRRAEPGGLDAGRHGPRHVESLDRTDVHADAAIDTAGVVDVDAIAHEPPPSVNGRSIDDDPTERHAHPNGWERSNG